MLRLDPSLIIDILSQLHPTDLLACAAVCRTLNEIITDSLRLQLRLRHYLYQTSHEEYGATDIGLNQNGGSRQCPPDEELRRLVTRETNLDRLEPRVSSFNLPRDQILHTISGKYVITQPGEDAERTDKSGRHILCTIWEDGKPRRVTVRFTPFSDLFDIDVQQDVIVVQEDEYGTDRSKTNVHLRFVHLFNETEEAEPHEIGVLRIREPEWQGGEPHNISLAPEGKVMIWCDGIVRVYVWRDGTYVGRLPPHRATRGVAWRSNLGNVWTDARTLVGLDLPYGENVSILDASLAIFNPDSFRLSSEPTPLLLELPFNHPKLTKVALRLLKLPDTTHIITPTDNLPYIQREGPYRLLVVATEFIVDRRHTMRLVVVVPTQYFDEIRLHRDRKEATRTDKTMSETPWNDEMNPFEAVTRLPFEEWQNRCLIWAEPAGSPNYFQGFYEAQHGLRLFNYDYGELEHMGNLRLSINDFNQRKLRWNHLDDLMPSTLGGANRLDVLRSIAPSEGERLQDRQQSRNYKKSVVPATSEHIGSINCSGEFVLGQKGRAKTFIFEGQRMAMQQWEHQKVWLFDFGASEQGYGGNERQRGRNGRGRGDEDVVMGEERTEAEQGQEIS
ncbi:hypothetical protein IAR55_001868 [Kwoniella newhampshirensis]|uniref:F-box domain-containing protein n=1 Tax=Kwoniella newhampshirensis TaxID=1651941 RepID=A0AAW0Z389_9TREE